MTVTIRDSKEAFQPRDQVHTPFNDEVRSSIGPDRTDRVSDSGALTCLATRLNRPEGAGLGPAPLLFVRSRS